MAIIVGVSVARFRDDRHDVVVRDTEREEIRTFPNMGVERMSVPGLAAFVAWVVKSEKADVVHVIGNAMGAGFAETLQQIVPQPVHVIQRYSEAVAATYMVSGQVARGADLPKALHNMRSMIDNERD